MDMKSHPASQDSLHSALDRKDLTSTPVLSPSPNIREATFALEDEVSLNPQTPRRPSFIARGLSLQMSGRDSSNAGHLPSVHGPLSPQLESNSAAGSQASLLPRRSRGLDFSRACTNLHHSTLAEQSSPDSSPTIMHKGLAISNRRTGSSNGQDSPNLGGRSNRQSLGMGERHPGSVGNVNMMASGSSSEDDESGDDEMNEDPMLSTPQVSRINNFNAFTPYGTEKMANPAVAWTPSFSPAAASLMSFRQARVRKKKSMRTSSSANVMSALASPGVSSPPPRQSVEGYFARDRSAKGMETRRQSVSISTSELHISSGQESGDEATPNPGTPGVIRRPVSRRGNMLPKTKNFARIRALLMEESTPAESDNKREGEIMKQVRENDVDVERPGSTATSSPNLFPQVSIVPDTIEEIPELVATEREKRLFSTFSRQASKCATSNQNFWETFDQRMRTPPPPFFMEKSTSLPEDVSMDSPSVSTPPPRWCQHMLREGETPS